MSITTPEKPGTKIDIKGLEEQAPEKITIRRRLGRLAGGFTEAGLSEANVLRARDAQIAENMATAHAETPGLPSTEYPNMKDMNPNVIARAAVLRETTEGTLGDLAVPQEEKDFRGNPQA